MPNQIVAAYRKYLAESGQADNSTDYQITQQLGQWAQQNNPRLLEEFPDFAEEYGQIREANAPSLSGELGTALKSGTQGLAATALGGLGLLTDSDYLKEKAASFEQDASANAPTIPTLEDIAPGRSGVGSLMSKDAVRYGIAKAGSVVPSLVEGVGAAALGSAIGTAVAPGPGTIAGAAEGLVARGLVKSAIRSLVKKGVAEELAAKGIISEATEEALEQAVRAGVTGAADKVALEGMAIGAKRGLAATNLANSFLLNTGDVASEGADVPTTIGLGLVSAIPDSILPGYLVKRMFPGVQASQALPLAKQFVGQRATKVLEAAGLSATEAGTEYFQEAVNVVARNLKDGKDALDFTDEDLKRFREAGIAGAFGGGLAAPALMLSPSEQTTRDLPTLPGPDMPGMPLPPAEPLANPLAGLADASVVEGIETPFDQVRAALQDDEAGRLLEQQQVEIDRQLAGFEVPPAEDLGRSLMGETPEVASEREAQRTAFGMAGVPVPDMSDPDQMAARETEAAGRALMGNVPDELAEPLQAPVGETPLPPPPTDPQVVKADRAEYDRLQAELKRIGYEKIGDPEFNAIWQQSENVKNRYGGMPPPTVEQVTLAQLPADVVKQVAVPAAPALADPQPVPATPEQAASLPPAPVPDAIKPQSLAKAAAPAFKFGPVVESSPTMDFRQAAESATLTPEQWAEVARKNMALGHRASKDSSKSDSRIAMVLQAPDGRVVVTGLTRPIRTLAASGQNILNEPTLQRMGIDRAGKRQLSVSGNKPALLTDAVAGGFKPLAILHFETEPGVIHEVFPSQQAFDASWGSSPKTTGKNIRPSELRGPVPRAARTEEELGSLIEKRGDDLLRAKPEDRAAIIADIKSLYARLDEVTRNNQDLTGDTHPPEYRQNVASAQAIQADKHSQFQKVISNLQNLGMRIDLFSRELLTQSTAAEIERRLAANQQQIDQAQDPALKAELARRQRVLQERLQDVASAAGVAYSPWHIALAADDIGKASTNNLVTLLHEAAEALTMRLSTEQRGAVRTAINKAMADVRERAAAASAATGVPLARETSATDLLAETLAQELTAAGIPDAPSLAAAIWRWIKDAYYRTAMALQAGFGAEPSPEMALDWYENQLRREVFGDYSYEMGNLLERFIPSGAKDRVERFSGRTATPGGIPDFLDPVSGLVRQPQVETLDRDALNWNLEFQQPGHPGQELEIPDPEARARIKGGVINAMGDFYEKLRTDIAPDMGWADFFSQIKRTGEEDPKLLLADLNQRIPGSGDARIGGDGMTDPMNREAQVELWGRMRKLGLSLRRQKARGEQAIAEASRTFTETAQDINRLEADLKNAALHSDRLKDRAKELVRGLSQSIARGRTTSHLQGALAADIREAENLLDSDPIPSAYQNVLKRLYDGETPVFDYVRAIADLDLPLSEMTTREVVAAINSGTDQNETLANLAANRPLAVTLATLARKNADQIDQIQLGWLRDTSRFREITDRLNEIKTATGEQLAALNRQITERGKASGLAARLQVSYLAKRRRQQAASDRIAAAEARNDLIEKAIPAVDEATADAAQAAGGAQYEWAPEEGAIWTAMRQDSEGNWRRHERVLRFNPDGSAVDGDQLRRDIASNVAWLSARRADEGKPRYNQIAAQTYALQLLDARGQQQRTWNSGILNAVDRFVRTPIASARSLGGPAMQRVIQMLNRYQFILRNYQKTIEVPAAEWQHEFTRMRKASGLTDNGEFIEQVYKPAMFFLSVNPGLEEGPAIRQAAALVRRSLPNPAEDFNERFASFIRKTKETETKLLAVAEQYGVFVADKQLGGELRRAVPRGFLTGMRSLNGGVIDVLTKDMQNAGWKIRFDEQVKDGKLVKTNPKAVTFAPLDPRNAEDPQTAEALWATLGSPEALQPLFARLFTGPVVGKWLEPFIRKPGQEPFSFDGEPIPQQLVRQAWDESGGNVLGWIDRLGQLLEVEADAQGHSPEAVFRLSMLRNLDQLFGHEFKIAADANQTPGLLDPHGAKPHALMDARVSDLLPPEHVNFSTYEPESMHRLVARVAYHGAFGRNARAIQAAFRENMNYLQGRNAEFQTLAGLHTSPARRQAEAVARGWNYDELRTAAKRYEEMKDFQAQLESVLGVSANSGPLGDFSKAMSMMNFMVGQIVDNPKTAAYNIISPAMRPFAQRSLGPKSISNTAKVYADILQTGLGSLFQSFGLHLFKAGKYADTIGNSEGRAFSNLPVSVLLSDIGHSGDNQSGLDKWLVKPLKIARNIQRKGVQLGGGEATEFPRLAVIPGLGVINSISNIETQAGGASLAREFEQLVKDGIKYFNAHPEAANNPSFQFKPSDLYRFKLDQPLFDWWKQKTVEYNMGNIEDIVRDAARRQAEQATDRLLTDDQAMQVSMMNQNEFSGNSSINTTPGWLMTNQFLRMVMPLMRWPLWMMSAVHEGMKPQVGESSAKPMLRALTTMALWNLPIGIAFSLLMDEYDDKLAGKKSNLPDVSGYAALPLVGLPLTMLTADKPLTELQAMMVRSARAGNIYGLGQDFAAQTMIGLDPATGQRSTSLDQRVLIASQLVNLQQALRNYMNQGFATWGSVARPLLMAVGGNGALHSVDIANNLLGLDNAQSRLTERSAAANWIRTAAQELDIDIRKGAGAGVPTPMSGHTREMYLAALANDRADFLEQYRLALNAARETVADDPTIAGPDREKEARKRVLSSWQSRNPFSVLTARPTEQQINRMLAIMDPKGQEAVRTAMARYSAYSAMIEPSEAERFFDRQFNAMRAQSDPASLRRQMTGSMMFSTR